jgi:hypothetical protein
LAHALKAYTSIPRPQLIPPQQQLLVQVKWPKVQEIEEMAMRYEEGGRTRWSVGPKIGAWEEVRKRDGA